VNYIDTLTSKGLSVPQCYLTFREDEDFEEYNGMIYPGLDKDCYSETTELYFDWDEHMLEELYDDDIPNLIPIAILHDTELVDDAYLAINIDDEKCHVVHCEIDAESNEVETDTIADSITDFLELLEHPEENYINYIEKKYTVTLPQRYKNFIQSYEYMTYNGNMKFDDNKLYFDEFPNLQWAAEQFNEDKLEWLPLASIGEDHNEYQDTIVVKIDDENLPVYFINSEETRLLASSLSQYLDASDLQQSNQADESNV